MEEKLILENQNLIYVVLKKLNLYNQREEYFDLGMIGLVKGVKSYDKNKGYKLSTYLNVCIKNEILMFLRKRRINCLSLETNITENLKIKDVIEDDNLNLDRFIYNNLYEAIHNLSFNDLLLFELYYVNNLTQLEISKKLNCSQVQVSRKLKNIYKKLKEYLDEAR